jgi:hypothetical protein
MKEKTLTISRYTMTAIAVVAIVYVTAVLETGSWIFFEDNKKEMPAEARQQIREYTECLKAHSKAFKQTIEQWKDNPSEKNRLRLSKVRDEHECEKILDKKYFRYDQTIDAFVFRDWENHENK